MSEQQQLKNGDMVQFNIGIPSGPVGFGRIVRMQTNGQYGIELQNPGTGASGVKFYNVTKVQK